MITQGELLMLLVKRDDRTTEDVAEAMDIDKSYLPKLYKMEFLPIKPLRKAIEVFAVPESYFNIKDESQVNMVSEPEVTYMPDYKNEITRLKSEVDRLNNLLDQERKLTANLAEALRNLTNK